jgi:outer membrane lipoprotein-sorting protein
MRWAARMPLLVFLLLPPAQAAAQQNDNNAQPAPLSLDQILTNLERKNAQRAAALEQFEGKRTYRMQYRGFFSEHDAEMTVKVRFAAPDSKQFTIISENGSKFVIEHIFKKLLESEQEVLKGDNRSETALTRDNYNFQLTGFESTPEGGRYVLTLQPKTKNKFLYRGKIWVDARDFAVVRIEGEPGRNPSMWITKTDFEHKYTKVDDFWLPSENHTETVVRLGGRSNLWIEYQDYKILKAAPLRGVESARIVPGPL